MLDLTRGGFPKAVLATLQVRGELLAAVKPGLARHPCGCRCRSATAFVLGGTRAWAGIDLAPRNGVLPWLSHRCGPACMEPDSGGPVIQGRRDPVTLEPLETVTPGKGESWG